MRIAVFAIVAVAGSTLTAETGPINPIVLEQRQREILLVRHLRQHVADPQDGLALAADRRELQRLRSGGSAAAGSVAATPGASAEDLVGSLRLITDVWYARLVERTPFVMMPRERLAALSGVQQALGQLQSRGGRSGLDAWLPQVQEEISALILAASGQGETSDAAVDLALRIADAADSSRPMIGPGPYPGTGPPAGVGRPPGPEPYPGSRSSGPTPDALPPGYEAYSGAAASGVGGIVACQTLRSAAGVSQTVSDMIRAAECWTRTPTWPGWSAQSLEALDWAVGLAAIERNCAALGTALDSLREIGPRLSAGGLEANVTALAQRGEADRRRLRGQSLCR